MHQNVPYASQALIVVEMKGHQVNPQAQQETKEVSNVLLCRDTFIKF